MKLKILDWLGILALIAFFAFISTPIVKFAIQQEQAKANQPFVEYPIFRIETEVTRVDFETGSSEKTKVTLSASDIHWRPSPEEEALIRDTFEEYSIEAGSEVSDGHVHLVFYLDGQEYPRVNTTSSIEIYKEGCLVLDNTYYPYYMVLNGQCSDTTLKWQAYWTQYYLERPSLFDIIFGF